MEETPVEEESLVEVVQTLSDEGLQLAGQDGEPLDMASQDTASTIKDGDPWFTVGGDTYQFLQTGGVCDEGVAYCYTGDTPIQAALDYIVTNNLSIDDKTLHVEKGTTDYHEQVTIVQNNLFDGLIILGDPGDLTEVGAGSNAPVLDGTGLNTGFTIYNEGVSIIGFIIQGFLTGILVDTGSGAENIHIDNNTIINNGIGVEQTGGTGKPHLYVNYNIFTGNGVALKNADGNNVQYIHAENNYWGCPSGPVLYGEETSGPKPRKSGYWQWVDGGFIYLGTTLPSTTCQLVDGRASLWDHQKNTADWSPFKINLNPVVGCPPGEVLIGGVCGIPGCTDPDATNYNADATVDDGTCTYPVEGCTDPDATNYDAAATVDDGSCTYPPVEGCTDPDATNYDAAATVDDGTCTYPPVEGCTDPDATNYDAAATVDDGTCTYPVEGCTDPDATNYDADATVDDGTCTYPVEGCTDPDATNYDADATVDDGTCTYPVEGCTDPDATNYDADSTVDDGTCTYPPVEGCTDPDATNYNADATVDDGTCTYPPVEGCTDPDATNYNADATVDDGSCTYPLVVYACTDPAATNYDATPGVVTDNTLCLYPPIVPPVIITVTGGPGLLIPVTGGVGGLIPVTGGNQIVSGLGHSCMPYGDGQVICWGLNASGQLGDGSTVDRNVADYVENMTGVLSLTAGSKHTCALTTENEVWCWGENTFGQLGDGTTQNKLLPVQVKGLPADVLSLSAGEDFTCAQLTSNEVWCWGKNNLGQLNDGSTKYQAKPVKAGLDANLAQISGGQNSLFVGDVLGDVLKWANLKSDPVQEVSNILSISADRWDDTGCSITLDGAILCWDAGLDSIQIENKLPALEIGKGMDHACVVNDDETVSCWGANLHGELGNGTNEASDLATLVKNMTSAHTLGVGAHHTCALVGASNLPMCWGENTYGQLGNESNENSNVPVAVVLPVK